MDVNHVLFLSFSFPLFFSFLPPPFSLLLVQNQKKKSFTLRERFFLFLLLRFFLFFFVDDSYCSMSMFLQDGTSGKGFKSVS